MTPEQLTMLTELYDWMKEKKRQQISLPLDDPSRNIIGGFQDEGAGSTTKTASINLTGDAETIIVPAPYIGTRSILIGGTRYEIPYIA